VIALLMLALPPRRVHATDEGDADGR
jgi:hypothetical protein